MVLRDPPEVKQYAKRGDPPIDQWPGRIVTREDLMKAGGDPRDWFRYGHRLKAYEEAWAEFADARRRGRNFKAGLDWNQILVLGDYGAGKTSVAVHMARHLFGLGHPSSRKSGLRCPVTIPLAPSAYTYTRRQAMDAPTRRCSSWRIRPQSNGESRMAAWPRLPEQIRTFQTEEV